MPHDRFSAPRLASELFRLKYPWQAPSRRKIRQYPGFAKEIRGTIQGSIIEKAAEDIIFAVNNKQRHHFSHESTYSMFHFPPAIGREEYRRQVHFFRKPEDLQIRGTADDKKVTTYIQGLFHRYLGREKRSLTFHHLPVMITLRRARKEIQDNRSDLFEALGLGIEIISAFVNSTKQTSLEKGIDHLTLIGNSIPLLIGLAKQNASAKGNGDLYSMFAIRNDESREDRAFQEVKEAFLNVPIQQAQHLITKMSKDILPKRDWNEQFIQKIKESSRIVNQIFDQQPNKHLPLRQVITLTPQLGNILEDLGLYSKYSTVNEVMRDIARRSKGPAFSRLKEVISEFDYQHEHKQRLLSSHYFAYNEKTQALEHKRNSDGKELLWQHVTPFDENLHFSDITPPASDPTIGCSAMLIPLKGRNTEVQQQINTFFSPFPKSIPRNAIGVGLILAYLASRE